LVGGFRYGDAAVVFQPSSRSTIKRELLVQAGVDPAVIDACTETTSFVMTKIETVVG
jgi:hypothetical protein